MLLNVAFVTENDPLIGCSIASVLALDANATGKLYVPVTVKVLKEFVVPDSKVGFFTPAVGLTNFNSLKLFDPFIVQVPVLSHSNDKL